MVRCDFCGRVVEKGTGKMLISDSGKIHYFCSGKCEKNALKLKRKSRELKWTETARKERK